MNFLTGMTFIVLGVSLIYVGAMMVTSTFLTNQQATDFARAQGEGLRRIMNKEKKQTCVENKND